jgi:hypothetical protein
MSIRTRLAAIPLALVIGGILSPVYSQNLEPKNGGTSAAQSAGQPTPPGVDPETLAKEKAASARGTNSSDADAMKAAKTPTTATKNKGP